MTKRFLSIRLSQAEFEKIQNHLRQSTCRSLTEYVKRVLTRQPVIVKVREQSREDILHQLGLIRSLLQNLADNTKSNADHQSTLSQIQSSIQKIAATC